MNYFQPGGPGSMPAGIPATMQPNSAIGISTNSISPQIMPVAEHRM